MATGISLANKSQLLFGFAVVLILGGALVVPWVWTSSLVIESQEQVLRELAESWVAGNVPLKVKIETTDSFAAVFAKQDDNVDDDDEPADVPMIENETPDVQPPAASPPPATLKVRIVPVDVLIDPLARAARASAEDHAESIFATRAFEFLSNNLDEEDYSEHQRTELGDVYHFARALSDDELTKVLIDRRSTEPPTTESEAARNRPIAALLVIDRESEFAAGQLLVTRIYLVAVWLFASLLAILVFYFILKKLIFSPVRKLRDAAEKVQSGDTEIRANIQTGDELEELAAAFNSMLARLTEGRQQLQKMNETLDLRVSELAEANFGLFESNRLKGEFLASVSHELRTPLNSIIGFSELLTEMAKHDEHADDKRKRYLKNILQSSRSLLEMINDLLEMAKIEAGRVELNIATTNVAELLGGLQALMSPQAEARQVRLGTQFRGNLPTIETDPGKLQQILYNFLSNAIKFTPADGEVTLIAERVTRQGNSPRVRLSVSDSGPGIPSDMQETIFEKFRQVDASHTREHQGVGLGLAICRELADMLGASLSVVSNPGEGAVFSVEVPVVYEPPKPKPLMGALS